MRCAPTASNRPNHLGLCALQKSLLTQLAEEFRFHSTAEQKAAYEPALPGGLSPNKMPLITSDYVMMRSPAHQMARITSGLRALQTGRSSSSPSRWVMAYSCSPYG